SPRLPYAARRPCVPPGTLAVDLALAASRRALAQAGREAEEIDLILSVSTSVDHIALAPEVMGPRLCHPLQRELGARRAFVFDLLDAEWTLALDVARGFCAGACAGSGCSRDEPRVGEELPAARSAATRSERS